MHVPPHRSHLTAKLSACSALLSRLPSAICALVITLVCALSVSVANGQAAVVQSVTSFGSGGNGASSYAIAKPTGLALGDLMILSVAMEGSATVSSNGFTEVRRQQNGSNFSLYVFRRIADATAVSANTFTVSFSSGGKHSVGLSRITGHNGTTPIATFSGATAASGTAVIAPTITTTAANQLVLSFHGVKAGASFSAGTGLTGSVGLTERYDVNAQPPSHAMYSYAQATAGATGTKRATSTVSGEWAAIQVAIASAPAAKTDPTITTAPTASAITFGQTLANSSITGGVTSTPGAFAFTTPSTAPGVGTASQSVTFTPTNTASFNTITTTVSVTVNKATPSITTAPSASAITFGQTLASSTLTGGNASTAGTFAFTTPATAPNAGPASQSVTFTPSNTTNFNSTTTTVSVTVAKANPTVTTVPTASSITFGQTLASSTLSGGVGSVAGSFAFTTPSTAPNAGTGAQGFTFTPTDSVNYNSATGTVSVTVAKATPTVTTVPTASSITFGQTLASSILSGGVGSVAGSFAFTTPGTAPNAGTAAQGFTFTPTDSASYNTATGTVDVTVTPRNLTITGLAGTSKVYDRSTTASASGTAALDGVLGADIVALSGTPAFVFVSSNVGTGIAITTTGYTLSGTNAANYSLTQPSLSANITAKSLAVTGLTGNDKPVDGTTNATASGTAALQGVVAGDSVSLAGTPIFTFASAGVGTGINITTTGYTLAGENAGNYTLTQPLLSANILDVPALVTGTAGSITRTTAQISGNQITSDGGSAITERGVVFSTNAQPTVSDTKVAVAGEIGAFAASLSGLTGGTTYYVRAYATNALTTVYGSAISFTANATPVFSGMALTVTKGGSLQIIESKLRPRITDPESNPVTITGAAATSQHGGTVTRSNRVITYTPSASFSGNDTFAVTVDDGFGASNITLTVAVTEDPLFTSSANAPRITTLDGGVVRVTFNGIPGRTYGIQRSTTMAAGSWTQISAVTAGSNSVVTFDDPNPPSPSAFYRIAFPAQ